jgi:hypothetical protein
VQVESDGLVYDIVHRFGAAVEVVAAATKLVSAADVDGCSRVLCERMDRKGGGR